MKRKTLKTTLLSFVIIPLLASCGQKEDNFDKSKEENTAAILNVMDKYDKDFDEYLLDVSCAGCERRIRNEDELRRAVGEYVHIKTREFEEDGYLKSFENGKVTVEYMDKTRKKAVTVNYDDIKMIRYAVKF